MCSDCRQDSPLSRGGKQSLFGFKWWWVRRISIAYKAHCGWTWFAYVDPHWFAGYYYLLLRPQAILPALRVSNGPQQTTAHAILKWIVLTKWQLTAYISAALIITGRTGIQLLLLCAKGKSHWPQKLYPSQQCWETQPWTAYTGACSHYKRQNVDRHSTFVIMCTGQEQMTAQAVSLWAVSINSTAGCILKHCPHHNRQKRHLKPRCHYCTVKDNLVTFVQVWLAAMKTIQSLKTP